MASTKTDYYDHPVFNSNDLYIHTRPMARMNEILHQWLWTGLTGGIVLGSPRVGKSRCVETLSNELYTRGQKHVPGYYMSMPPRDQNTITTVFRQLCLSAKLRVTTHDRADILSDRYVQLVYERACADECHKAVLFVDEMQRLVPKQFNAFAELYDKLLLMGVDLMIVFVGNDQESSKLIETIGNPQYAHIHGRFFTQGHVFKGLASSEEVKHCLKQYDQLRFPKRGPTYTGYFLPKAVKKGWKLASLAGDLWRVFREYKSNYHIDSLGMQYFTTTINTLLIDFLPAYGTENVDDEMLHECIRISGLIPSLVMPVK